MWALDPHALSLGLVTVLRQWTCSLLCPVCTSQMYRYGSIPSHPPTCQGRHVPGDMHAPVERPTRDPVRLRLAYVACHSSQQSQRVSSRPPPPRRRLAHETQPWLALPCPRLWLGPPDSDLGMVQVVAPRGPGEGWMCVPAGGWSIDAAKPKPQAAQCLSIDQLMGVYSADANVASTV
jgi:hypothetical protein